MAIDQFKSEGRLISAQQVQIRGVATAMETLTGAVQLTAKSAQILKLDPGGAGRNVTLPGVAQGIPNTDGLPFFISNAADAAENLVVQQPGGATLVTLNQNEAALIVGIGGQLYAHYGVLAIAQT
jgi:hypothetical protein